MRQFDAGVADACGLRNGEDLFEMQGLSGIHKVQHAICFEIANSSAQARKVRCGVQIAAVGFLHDDRLYFAFLILEFVQKYALGTVRFREQILPTDVIDRGFQVIVVGTFAVQIRIGEVDTQSIIKLLTVRHGNLNEPLPLHQHGRVARLKQHNGLSTAPLKVLIGIEAQLCLTIEIFQIRQRIRCCALFRHESQQHAELCAPVPDMVLSNDRMAQTFQHPSDAVSDDGAAQVPNMHLLGQIRARVVYDYALRVGAWLGGGCCVGDELRRKGNVDEAGSCHSQVARDAVKIDDVDDRLRNLTRVLVRAFGGGHNAVGLIIAKFRATGGLQQCLAGQTQGSEGRLDAL